jgi:endonuclease YncB( thermonuclease family)
VRQAYKVWSGIAAGVFCLVAVTDLGSDGTTTTPTASTAASDAASSSSLVGSPTAGSGAAAVGTTVSVLKVIDGDSFRTADGREVRVLGIDSCEAATPGGRRATGAAQQELLGVPVVLTAEPGVDRDRYGRELRYVTAGGRDFAADMVTADHTAIYTDGRNDASLRVQAQLRALDTDGRVCGGPAPPTTARSTPDVDVDRPATRRPVVPAAPAAPAAPSSGGSGGSASYAHCAAARAAGAAPLHRGEPGYSGKLDRDGDGVACE